MARPIEAVKDINDSKDLWKIVVRCKHMWTMTSSSNKQHSELILLDSNLDMIQAIVPPHLVSKYLAELAIGGSYIMQNFKVSNNDFSFKSSTHSFKLVFCGSTYIRKAKLLDIPVNYLNIIGLDTIVDGKFQSNLLVDIVGGVTEIVQTQINADNRKSKAVFIITDMSKSLVQCTLWGQLALQFYEYYKTHNEEGNVVVLLQNARIKGAQGSYSEFDKFIWKAEILSEAEISSLQHETTCVTVAKLEKFEAGQAGWYYDGCGVCTTSVSLKDGNLKCYANHITNETVPRYKLEILEGEDNPWEFPFELDAILKKELAIRAVFQPKFERLSVASKLGVSEPCSQEDFRSFSEPLSASADYDPSVVNSWLTPSKRTITDVV
ncbi:uncharacterized protein LOC131604922 [Vicia villosa]|uniref:uncharacterized protein LOC131604922 n=1 Tax=Vicia villosa TaxID=3911 RepID=UPI00273B06ED|nr:uncharacterized protein LOC131604922 [Vicia villosa]